MTCEKCDILEEQLGELTQRVFKLEQILEHRRRGRRHYIHIPRIGRGASSTF